MSADILQEQVQYYRERASEYDEWFFQGRYDRERNSVNSGFLKFPVEAASGF